MTGEKMQKFGLIVADPPWSFDDKLKYEKKDNVVRGAAGKYPTLNPRTIADLPVGELAAENSLLALWVPSSQLLNGVCMPLSLGCSSFSPSGSMPHPYGPGM